MNKYLLKDFFVIENDSMQLSMLPNDVKLTINVIDQLETDFFMEKIYSNFLCRRHHKKVTYSETFVFDLSTRLI